MASLLSVENLQVQFQTKKGINTAVDGVSFSVKKAGFSECRRVRMRKKCHIHVYPSASWKQRPGFPAAASNWMEKN